MVLHPHIPRRAGPWVECEPLWRASLGSALPQTDSQRPGAATSSLPGKLASNDPKP